MIDLIDLNTIPTNLDIPINNIIKLNYSAAENNDEYKFQYEPVEIEDSSASIYYTQNNSKILVSVYGPREVKYRDKLKNEQAIVEVYTKFNCEISREKLRKLNSFIENFCEGIILLDSYPRCQINICINIISFQDEKLITTTVLNGIMLALVLSGIDLKSFSLCTFFQDEAKSLELIISLDANNPENIMLIESNLPLKMEMYKKYLEKSKDQVMELYKRFKKVLLKKLIQ